MRIIAGSLGGRRLKSPASQRSHPMSEKIRGALFSSLGDLSGLSVLDAYGGSGAIGLEAISRGANRAVIIEVDRRAQTVIATNINDLVLTDRAKLIKASVLAWLGTSSDMFDVVICDPPYSSVHFPTLTKLSSRVNPGGLLVVSAPPDCVFNKFKGFDVLKEADYSDATLHYFRALEQSSNSG